MTLLESFSGAVISLFYERKDYSAIIQKMKSMTDLFPRTPAYDLFPCTADIQAIVSTHMETVVLLSKGEIDSKKVRVEFSPENREASDFQ